MMEGVSTDIADNHNSKCILDICEDNGDEQAMEVNSTILNGLHSAQEQSHHLTSSINTGLVSASVCTKDVYDIDSDEDSLTDHKYTPLKSLNIPRDGSAVKAVILETQTTSDILNLTEVSKSLEHRTINGADAKGSFRITGSGPDNTGEAMECGTIVHNTAQTEMQLECVHDTLSQEDNPQGQTVTYLQNYYHQHCQKEANPQSEKATYPQNHYHQHCQKEANPQSENATYLQNHIDSQSQKAANPQSEKATYPQNHNDLQSQREANPQSEKATHGQNHDDSQSQREANPQCENATYPQNHYDSQSQREANPQSEKATHGQNHDDSQSQREANPQCENATYPQNHIDSQSQKAANPLSEKTTYPQNHYDSQSQREANPQCENATYPQNHNDLQSQKAANPLSEKATYPQNHYDSQSQREANPQGEMVTHGESHNHPHCPQEPNPKSYVSHRQCSEDSSPSQCQREAVYIHSDRYLHLCNEMIRVPGRANMVHSLIDAYGLFRYLKVISPEEVSRETLLQFHSVDYIDVLERLNVLGEEGYDEDSQACGIGYDCPALKGVLDYASLVAGATVTAADWLIQGKTQLAINWLGGWHHAKKDEASGFCYINDIVLGILKLREKYQRVLYIDLDLHHGDGVEDAFSATSKVFTLSFHKYDVGFFPGTGSMRDVGFGKGKYFTLNIPFLDGVQDDQFCGMFSRILERVREIYSPEVIVCQCGADGLAGDPMNSFNLSHLSLAKCVLLLTQWNIPLLLLGGGGYNHANTARAWTFLTSIAVRKKLSPDIPDHEYFTEYGPSYELRVSPGNRKNLNSRQYLTEVYRTALGILQKTKEALASQSSKIQK